MRQGLLVVLSLAFATPACAGVGPEVASDPAEANGLHVDRYAPRDLPWRLPPDARITLVGQDKRRVELPPGSIVTREDKNLCIDIGGGEPLQVIPTRAFAAIEVRAALPPAGADTGSEARRAVTNALFAITAEALKAAHDADHPWPNEDKPPAP